MKKTGSKGFGAFLVVALVLVAVGWLLWRVPVEIAGLVGAGVGFLASKVYESFKEASSRLYDRKREVYLKLLQPWRDLIWSMTVQPGKNLDDALPKDFVKDAMSAAFDASLFASDDVIRTYGRFRTMSVAGPVSSEVVMVRLAALLVAMRKDLGHRLTAVTNEEILRLFVNLDEAQSQRLKEVA